MNKRKQSIILVDLVEDQVKSRWLFIIGSLLFYVYMTWVLFFSKEKIDSNPRIIENPYEFARYIKLGQKVSEIRMPEAKVLDQNQVPMKGIEVKIKVIKITSDTHIKDGPICDSDYRQDISGSLEYLRFADVCKVRLSGNKAKTDKIGHVTFDDFIIENGPNAIYTLQFVVKIDENSSVISKSFAVSVFSDILELESLVPKSMYYAMPRHPIYIQPKIRVTDINGKI